MDEGTRQQRELQPRPLRSELGRFNDFARWAVEPMAEGEIVDRIAVCARILDAWPNARPTNRDRTLLEYVNATRGVPLERLGQCVQLAIDAGGDFMPPAGDVLRRAAVQAAGGRPVGTDRDSLFWHEKRVAQTVERYRCLAERVAPLNPEEMLPSGPATPRLESGM